ncbi:cytoplasmic tRNA 2-thiolation protein 1 [Cryptococcus deuterogattii 99/473]|uniref:Cytoplasmic tRNA 2-thiolation protein 1 n=1 Tax=Cryptococcus deuterogattii Ram5 TaxID=1296110 RepID=A0A0D0USU1_9TREE|nr:cytoplasmic tRNA 2-thiolation protein 1 [Cryptococcus deuterogattii Ram5]KIR73596.1 cytoplasmic tRNA 2-thiolation protein 1 [Cryptococcus deuterogattii CA1014]KIR99651.1 cytoplasmic tRNA 2-thiolation protein 1 [Cryptococcus deuterogattii 2001/935-1]KIY58156.1 cytoplasmic tRNA 2-thiolation protein 1 [Cryptococcus deuterogattii 99/473]
MPPTPCSLCHTARALVKRPKTGQQVCKDCFFEVFETEVHNTIVEGEGIFKRGERVAIGASGGKDSTVLAHVLSVLNKRYDYGLDLYLLSIDEGITGYRDDSLETVKQNQVEYGLPLKILSYSELYGWTMDKIVEQVGKKNNCTFCGVFRRQALDRGAAQLGVDHIVTGHNADDIAETVLMNIMRGDIARLARCTAVTTQSEDTIKRSKPFKYAYEKEIVIGHARVFLKDLESVRPSAIVDIIHSGESFVLEQSVQRGMKALQTCLRCGYISSNDLCKACALLEGLESGLSRSALRQTQESTSAAPEGHRTIPMFERYASLNGTPKTPATPAEPVEGIERAVKTIEIV